jgi:hypothetical protein
MTWKSYAAVSGATVLAGWLASAQPSNAPAGAPSPQTRSGSDPRVARGGQTRMTAANAPTDIELQAMRLQARLRPGREYPQPMRDPFRFAARRTAAAPIEGDRIADASAPPAPANPPPPAPTVSLSGIAEDQVDGRPVRAAVLSTPVGVLIVREGDEILGFYRVARIEPDAVELVATGDGATRRISLK